VIASAGWPSRYSRRLSPPVSSACRYLSEAVASAQQDDGVPAKDPSLLARCHSVYVCCAQPGAYATHRERDLLVITDHVVLGNRPPPDATSASGCKRPSPDERLPPIAVGATAPRRRSARSSARTVRNRGFGRTSRTRRPCGCQRPPEISDGRVEGVWLTGQRGLAEFSGGKVCPTTDAHRQTSDLANCQAAAGSGCALEVGKAIASL
jgi:hypothetical protein